ncbi:MAG: ABC transporter ATP-binding protein [Firmicutes bacterium]|nr:ABC transporter ATP-binding protein [Bacillota bacterium]
MGYLTIKGLTKKYDGNTVLDNIDIEIEQGILLSLLGPSGCGKTTALRLIAGFEKPDAGIIEINGRIVNNIPVYKRNIGMVFQSYALFPHMTVEQNIAYGLEQRKMPRDKIKEEVAQVIEMVQLKGFEKRKPRQLSGGQQQRVALARALVIEPDLLLLDESLSALDKKLRVDMQVELRQIQQKVGITTIFVTHDQEEALTMSDKIAVMKEGKIMQIDTPENIYEHPSNTFVAGFLGEANFFRGQTVEKVGDIYNLKLQNGEILQFMTGRSLKIGEKCTLAVRPEKVNLDKEKPSDLSIKGIVKFITYAGDISIYRIESLGQEIKVKQQNLRRTARFSIGDEVYMSWSPENNLILDCKGDV